MTKTRTAATTNALAAKVERMRSAILSQNPRNEYNAWLASRSPARGFGKRELYPLGFKKASDELIEHLAEEGAPSHLTDALVYPIVYNYRHYIELRLKNQIWRLSGFPMDDSSSPRGVVGHDLLQLWTTLRGLLEKQYGEDRNGEIRFLENYEKIHARIQVLHELDAGSLSFRYADAYFPIPEEDTDMAVINLEEFKRHVAKLSDEMDRIGLN